MRTDYETLLVRVDGPIVEVLLNRPAKRNAINFALVREFNAVLAEAKYDRSVRVVTVCGEGKVFSNWRPGSPGPTRASSSPTPAPG